MFRRTHFIAILAGSTLVVSGAPAEESNKKSTDTKSATRTPAPARPLEKIVAGSRKKEPLIDVSQYSPPIFIELRYATARNLAGHAIYPEGARCLLRQGVLERLIVAQAWLEVHAPGTNLKIWDGYRPAAAHRLLWKVLPNKEYLGDPQRLGSLHTWGVCVDVTLCDAEGHDLSMPTDFDVLTPEASTYYSGDDDTVKRHLTLLQNAMHTGGFMVLRDEWWHFVARDYQAYGPVDVPLAPLKKH